MIIKRLMTVTNDYYVEPTSVRTKGLHVILDVELYPFDPEPVISIIEKLDAIDRCPRWEAQLDLQPFGPNGE